MRKQNNRTVSRAAAAGKKPVAATPAAEQTKARRWRSLRLPVIPIFFVMVWVWAWAYYGSVFHISREYSFWATDSRLLQYFMSCSFASLRYVGRMLLQLYQYPWLGGLLVAFMLTAGTWLTGYCMRLSARWRFVQYIPAMAYIGGITYYGLDIFFEAEAGYILGIPFVALLILTIWGVIIRSFSRKPTPAVIAIPRDESMAQNLLQLVVPIVVFAASIAFCEVKRPEVRTVCRMMSLHNEHDWWAVQKVARDNAILSNRPMACYYAISLLHTGLIAERMYDIRLDYDNFFLHGVDGYQNIGNGLYIPEGCYHAGFVESCMHNCMELMVMQGPTPRLLKLLIKCALMRGEWELAEKYLTILGKVPFEGAFCEKYGAMVRRPNLVNADPEMAAIRQTEPIHDSFENQYQAPVFMGYNLALVEGRSMQALTNSLCVCLYTKVMPQFIERLPPIYGTMQPEIISDGILLATAKQPGIDGKFNGLDYRRGKLQAFMEAMKPYIKDRPGNAYKLFPKHKGYYPYYYYFGNLKATKKGYTGQTTSNSGVN